MDNRDRKKRTSFLSAIILIVLAFVLIVTAFILSQKSQNASIELPSDLNGQTPPMQNNASLNSGFLQVSPENVLTVVETLHRPSSYHQSLTLLNTEGIRSFVQGINLWMNGQFLRAVTVSDTGTETILSDRKTAYLWNENQKQPFRIDLTDSLSYDDILGLPTYETLLSSDPGSILDAEYVIIEDQLLQCIYVVTKGQDDTIEEYWIDIESGLLVQYVVSVNGQNVYYVYQETYEELSPKDEVFSDMFCLPDGSDPFLSE